MTPNEHVESPFEEVEKARLAYITARLLYENSSWRAGRQRREEMLKARDRFFELIKRAANSRAN